MIVSAFIGALLVIGIMILVLIRKLGHSKSLVQTTRISAARSEAKALSAKEAADKLGNIAEHALGQTDDALAIASVIKSVDGKVDELLAHVSTPDQPQQGKHARRIELRIVQDGEEQRYTA